MKQSIFILPFLLAMLLVTILGCEDDKESAEPAVIGQMKKLTGNWRATSVTFEDAMQEDWQNFSLKISPVAGKEKLYYLVANNPYKTVWISTITGNFTFEENDPENYLIREDGVSIGYDVSEETLSIHFTYQETETGGRISGVTGLWKFDFERVQN